MISVLIPSQLTSYTDGASRVQADGATVEAALDDLDRRFPGLKFRVIDEQDRIRRHMRIFIGMEEARDLRRTLQAGDELMIFGALSGG
jgi:molybdopterin converting factor small subunit